MLPQLLQLQRVVEVRARMDACLQSGEYARALRMCSQCLVLIEEQSGIVALMDMNQRIEVRERGWGRVGRVEACSRASWHSWT